jgi:predicted nuclease of predicted toxin-antitoxin system
MSVGLYMDVHVRRAVTEALRLRGVDVLTAQQDGARELDDSALLNRATALGRVLFSQDDDLLREAVRRQRGGEPFGGVIYAHQLNVTIGECVDDLELIAQATVLHDWENRLTYLPLK